MTVVIAHAIAYGLTAALPRTGVAVLGIGAADPDVVTRFSSQIDSPQSYLEALARLLSWNFGRTIDGVDTSEAIANAAANSMPILALSIVLTAGALVISLWRSDTIASTMTTRLLEFITFLPAYVFGFLVLAISVLTGSALIYEDAFLRQCVLAATIGCAPACFVVVSTRIAFNTELKKPYVVFMRACGHGHGGLCRGVRRAVILNFIYTWDKIVGIMLSVLIFTEAIFSYPGLGAFTLLAVQRTDINAILAVVTHFAIAVVCLRLISGVARAILDPRYDEDTVKC